MIFLKQSTASQSVLLGPFIDDTDGKTAETGLTIANTDIRLSKNGGNMAAKTSGGGTHDEAGWYTITLDATDTNTVGRLQISAHVAGALPVHRECQVLEEAVYDALFGSGATGYNETTPLDAAGVRSAVGLTTANLDTQLGDIPTVSEFEARTLLAASYFDSTADQVTVGTNNDKTGYSLTQSFPTNFSSLGINVSGHVERVTLVDTTTTNTDMVGTDGANTTTPPTTAAIADAVWDEARSGHVTAGTYGETLATVETNIDNLDAAVSGANTTTPLDAAGIRSAVGLATANLDTQLGDVPTVAEFNARTLVAASYFDPAVDTVTVGTNNDKTGYSLTVTPPTSAAIADAVWDEAQSGHVTAGTFGLYLDTEVSGVSGGGGASAADIADAVWDEARSGHVTAGTYGETLATVEANIDNLDAAVSSASTHSAADVWTSGTRALTDKAGFTISGTITTLDALDTAQDSQHSTTQASIAALNDPTAAAIADAVWDEAQSGHTTAGTFGLYLDSAVSSAGGSSLTLADIADAVWDEVQSGHATAGTFGAYVDSSISGVSTGGVSAADIADAVWDEVQSGHTTAGTFGLYVDSAISGILDILASQVATSMPVDTTGQITAPIVIGDDYLAANDRAFEWTVDEVTGFTAGSAATNFAAENADGDSFSVTGTITDNLDGTWTLSFDVQKTDTTGLPAGWYKWSVEVSEGGVEITRVRLDPDIFNPNARGVELIEKQT